ncbi:hypothetical protein EGI31_02790 [Lacihabitans soyangensis]|uniref:Uncharacterized protein n=1 Tax=Lacihabitans soyangensis TaxID=869394 RepID=A0AAE3GZ18_9BACT|nr:hypothetical protein [Lacihabitans soyangensis]
MKLQNLLVLSLFLLLGIAWAQPGPTHFAQITELAYEAVYDKNFAEAAKKITELEKICLATKSRTQFFELCY